MAYICRDCGRTGRLPDSCCGTPMVSQGSYVCRSCGNSQRTPGNCCGETMTQV